jgi:probable F420-dependent oxidoreductase
VQFGVQLYQSLRELPSQSKILDNLDTLESKGFRSFNVMDHHLRTFDDGYLSPLLTLAYCAARTEIATLGQAIIITTLHHPIHLAEQFATVDQLSKGRLVIGAGVGWNREEFKAFGVPYQQRTRIFEESISVIRRLWAGETVTYSNGTYGFHDVTLGLRPYEGRTVPILLAGIEKNSLARIARFGDGWVPSLWISEDELDVALGRLRLAYSKNQRTEQPHVTVSRFCYVRPNREDAWSTAEEALSRYLSIRSEWDHPILASHGEVSRENVASRTIVGNIEDAIRSVQKYADMGIHQLNFRLSLEGFSPDQVWETAELLADEVMPAVTSIK